jgi:hypothetical protein
MYILTEDNKIKEILCGDIPESYNDKTIVTVPSNSDVSYQYPDIRFYDENWKLKPLDVLLDEELYILSPNEKYEDGFIKIKSDIEMMKEGLINIPEGYEIVNDELSLIITNEMKLKNEKDDLLSYLNNTDWYITRFAETDKPIPADILLKRAEARDRISEIRDIAIG